jgi:hypothetical protein
VPFAFATTLRPHQGVREHVFGHGPDIAAAEADAATQIASEVIPPLVEATTGIASVCGFEESGKPSVVLPDRFPPGWRIVLGPLWRWTATGRAPCCLHCILTVGSGALAPLFERGAPACLRIFVGRKADGSAQADCRVDGTDRPEMAARIVERARLWPAEDGFTMRRQTLMLVPPGSTHGDPP